MKNIMKVFASFLVVGVLGLFISVQVSASNEDENILEAVKNKCQYTPQQNVNPDKQTLNCLLTEMALAYDVPPEIVKAIAERENGGWQHFDDHGNVVISADNGIGLMQITNKTDYNEESLKNDIAYNIQAGVKTLDYMFSRSDLPSINSKERDVLEHWYFAVMAYNGTKPVNSPIIQATGERNTEAYQEKVYDIISDLSLEKTSDLPFSREDFQYDSNSNENIKFLTMKYNFNVPFTKSKYGFTTGQKVEITDVNVKIRPQPSTSSTIGYFTKGEVVTIAGPFQYDSNKDSQNHFVWYPVKRSNGTTGFIASSYLKLKFKDVPNGHYAEDSIDYLVDRGILKGVGNDNFGIGQRLTRWQAVLLLTRANNVSLDNRPDPGFIDVPKSYKYYKEIAAAVEVGLFQGVSEKEFQPNATLTRNQMAVLLQRLYQFPTANIKHPFTDVTEKWYADAVARLYASGITDGVTKTKFGPKQTVTREQFAVFMVRSMDEQYRLK